MYRTVIFTRMKLINCLLFLILLTGCTSDNSTDAISIEHPEEINQPTIDELVVRHIEGTLRIPATEKYTYTIYQEQLDLDDSVDFVISVNRLNYAIDQSINSGKVSKQSTLGFMGTFNFLFYMDGATKKLTAPIPIASSAKRALSVRFENIRSEMYKDVIVDYGIRNSLFTRIYTTKEKDLRQTFEAKTYDGLGESNTEAFYFKYVDGSYSLAKDIHVYKGKLENIITENPDEIYSIIPKIEETNVLEREWFFNDNILKYYTRTE